ncbi:cupin domain-containing protein [Changpingibacter yushuensis]|uniref:cupin domain-containing protein n=1 Tax=Changpingibacter yushuensis TaxID=2758440 RepID=UPI0015F77ADE|nr:cupin domain-containing protein [Changpingibacter yushuensis]
MSDQGFDGVFPRGEANTAFGKYFIGRSYLNMLTTEGMGVGFVTFEPGCRNNWHIHHASKGGGQILLCTAGSGWYQAEGEEPVSMVAGSVVQIPTGQKHWHGAKADSWFSHIAIEVPGEDTGTEWLEPVANEYYGKLPQA